MPWRFRPAPQWDRSRSLRFLPISRAGLADRAPTQVAFAARAGYKHSKMRAIFFGTPEIAVPALHALAEVAEIVAVVSQPDRPAGRGLQLAMPAVKQAALALGVPV